MSKIFTRQISREIFRTLEPRLQEAAVEPHVPRERPELLEALRFLHKSRLAQRADKPGFDAPAGESQIGVVLPKEQPVFGAAREHAIGLRRAPGHQVVNQDADVGFVAGEGERWDVRESFNAAFAPAINPWAAASS